MAGAHCAIFSFLAPPPTAPAPARTSTAAADNRVKPILLTSISTPFPSKLTRRRNYLRPKILKTLPEPYPTTPLLPQEPQNNPLISTRSPETPSKNDVVIETPAAESVAPIFVVKDDKAEEFQVSESVGTSADYSGGFGKFSPRYVLKFGLYLVGIFVFQTVCAVLIFGNSNSDKKDENSDTSDAGYNGNGKIFDGKFGTNGSNVGYLDEIELEERIKEIRAMARDARRSEEKYQKDSVEDGDIEKEIDTKLVRLQKKLNSHPAKLHGSNVNFSAKPGKVEDRVNKDSLDVKEVTTALMFNRNLKFVSSLTDQRSNSNEVNGLEDHSVTKKKKNVSGSVDAVVSSGEIDNNGRDLLDLPNEGEQGSVSGTLEEDDGGSKTVTEESKLPNDVNRLKKQSGRTEVGGAETEPRAAVIQETNNQRVPVEIVKSRESKKLDAQNSQNFTKESRDIKTKSDKPDGLSKNGRSKCRKVESKVAVHKVRDKQVDGEAEFWWLNLHYVHAILMCRGSDNEEPGGLFTLKTPSREQDEIYSSYTVTFEDRGDANNFCYLLESFFEDLGDFIVDIVPFPIKELHEAVKSHTMKVIVVKKGQLQLYAGQPFADVEAALHSLVVLNQSDYPANPK